MISDLTKYLLVIIPLCMWIMVAIYNIFIPILGFVCYGIDSVVVYNSCQDVHASGISESHEYIIDPDGAGGTDPFEAMCKFVDLLNHNIVFKA